MTLRRPTEPAQHAEPRLPRPPGVLRRWLAAHPRFVDLFIAVSYLFGYTLMLLLTVVSGDFTPGETQVGSLEWLRTAPLLDTIAVLLAGTLRAGLVFTALLMRRRIPLIGLIVVALLLSTHGTNPFTAFADIVALLFMMYAVPVYGSVRKGWLAWVIASLLGALAALIDQGDIALIGWDTIVAPSVLFLIALLIGINLGNRRRYLQAIIDRAHQLARERDQRAQLAVAEERSRIAREMHDIVAHSVSVMVALSEGSARTVTLAPDAARDAMERSAETGRTALAEMRRLLGALTDREPADRAPQPGIAELPALVGDFRAAQIHIECQTTGESRGDRGQELAVYRVVQESLTNVLRHAGPGAHAAVSVVHAPEHTTVEVESDAARVAHAAGAHGGPGAPISAVDHAPRLSDLGSGLGLAGLAERVRMFGGSFEAGALPGGAGKRWRVRATLPVNALTLGVGVEVGAAAGTVGAVGAVTSVEGGAGYETVAEGNDRA